MTRLAFLGDMPNATVFPSDDSNYYKPEGHGGVPNRPRAFILHTPEEPWDNFESTPNFFAAPNRQASTHYYLDSDGEIWQLVPERCAAIANGLLGKPLPSWASPGSLNWQTLSVEIEGYAGQIQNTLIPGEAQFLGLVYLIKERCRAWGIPLDREHIMGHYQLSTARSDPGAGFPWEALMAALGEPELSQAEQEELGDRRAMAFVLRELTWPSPGQVGEGIYRPVSVDDNGTHLLIELRNPDRTPLAEPVRFWVRK